MNYSLDSSGLFTSPILTMLEGLLHFLLVVLWYLLVLAYCLLGSGEKAFWCSQPDPLSTKLHTMRQDSIHLFGCRPNCVREFRHRQFILSQRF
ncbi:hypothetical protein Pdw03_4971 [Penicillium digitatum]|uniref:Uncharacterized protein n=1 Tax=Penicillium digitatum TaxID=36651 RepID=A0A7T7BJR6_PENDI|nr:hypothetical protein Pdw03_4950 [Penicillium digitatum]QQK42117.1 hypothetical protein Pdw03_4971 [Penicillium digitatum]